MTEKKITKRDNFNTIVEVLTAAGREDLAAVITHEIELLDNKAAKAKATAAKKKSEGDELTAAVEAVLTDELATIADITEKVDGEDVTVAKVQYRLTQLVKNGKACKEQITIEATDGGKARKIMAYKIAE